MTSQEIRAFVDQHVEAWKNHDVRTLVDGYADECELISPLFQTVRGKAGIEASFRDIFRIFADQTIRSDDLLVDHERGDRAAYVATYTATHVGEVLGFPPSGRRVTIRGVFLFRFEDHRIIAEQRLYDFTELLLQLGVLKAKAG
jgi:steroid delta-isomerase-like uncharacterized protein